MQCMLGKATLKECLYWTLELSSSDENAGEGLVTMCKLLYGVGNPGLVEYVTRKATKYEDSKDELQLYAIVLNLRLAESDPIGHAFISLKHMDTCDVSRVYKNPGSFDGVNSNHQGMLRSIVHRDLHNVAAYDSIYDDSGIVRSLVDRLASSIGIENICDDLGNTTFDDACAIARYFAMDKHINGQKKLRVRPRRQEVDEMKQHLSNPQCKYWERLSALRLYPIHDFTGPCSYMRGVPEDLKKISWYSWEYYCFESRLWNKRFLDYGATRNEEKKSVDFPDDDNLEAFYELYCRDFDEQPFDVQNMSLRDVFRVECPFEWYERAANANAGCALALAKLKM